MKQCSKCKQTLLTTFFNAHIGRKDGLCSACYLCEKATRIRKPYYTKQRQYTETMTPHEIWEVINLFKHKCFNCDKEPRRITLDHCYNDAPMSLLNCVPLCNECNASKRSKTIKEFYPDMKQKLLILAHKSLF